MEIRQLKRFWWLPTVCLFAACGDDAAGGAGEIRDMGGDASADVSVDRADALSDSDITRNTVTIQTSALSLTVTLDPFSFEVRAGERQVLASLDLSVEVPNDPAPGAYGPPGVTFHAVEDRERESWGWDTEGGTDAVWTLFDETLETEFPPGGVVLRLGSGRRDDLTLAVELTASQNQVEVVLELEGEAAPEFNRIGQSFRLGSQEHFFGLGGRAVTVDHLGHSFDVWVEESGRGAGEGEEADAMNPYPNGPGMTSFPVPFLLSTSGYGLWLDTEMRSRFHLGAHSSSYWRVEAADTRLAMTIAVNADPLRTLADFTNATGRAPLPPEWAFGPRRRLELGRTVDGLPEWQALRARGVATTVIEDREAWLPVSEHADEEMWLEERLGALHDWGYRVLGLAAPLLAAEDASIASRYQEAERQGYLVVDPGGDPYLIDVPIGDGVTAALVDLSENTARTWFEQLLAEGLALGYDGWRVAYADRVPPDAVFGDGATGREWRNAYPNLTAQAVANVLESHLPGNSALVQSSGYLGGAAEGLLAWAAGSNASFDPVDGLPAAVRMGINLGISGYPFYGSDIGGNESIDEAAADKETYLRWTAFAALSPLMHDEDVGVGSEGRWGLWSDEETLTVYASYARLHTRLVPYLHALAREASETGAPLMRHLFLHHPADVATWTLDDEYLLGPGLLVAPVVERGAVARQVYFPAGRFVGWETKEVFQGPGWRDIAAPLGSLPLFRVDGGIVPMYDREIDTVAPEEHVDVVGPADVGEWLDVLAVRSSGASTLTLADGAILDIEVNGVVSGPFCLGARCCPDGTTCTDPPEELPFAITADEVATCEAGCYRLREVEGAPTTLWLTTPLGENVEVYGNGITLSLTSPPARPRRIRWEVILLGEESPETAQE